MHTQTESRFETRHKLLLQAGRDIIVKQGIASISMDALASAVNISRPTAYHHFKNADDAFEKIAMAGLVTVNNVVTGALSCEGSAKMRMIALLMVYELVGRFHPDDYNVVEKLSYPWVQEKFSEPLMASYRKWVIEYLGEMAVCVDDGVADGELEAVPLGMTSMQFASNMLSIANGLSTSIVKQRIAHRTSQPRDEWGEMRRMLAGILDGVGWKEPILLDEVESFFRAILKQTFPDYWLKIETGRLENELED